MRKILSQKIIPIIFFTGMILTSIGCDIKREAIGADDEIMVITDNASKEAITIALSSIFNDTIYTPKPESQYKLKYVDPVGYNGIKEINNVIIGSIGNNELNPSTKLVMTLLGEDRYLKSLQGKDQVVFTFDQFAKNQVFMILSANSVDDLMSSLNGKREWIKEQFDEKMKQRQRNFLFKSARHKKEEKALAEKYPWSIKIPWGWEVIKDSVEAHFVWLGREMPYQWITIHGENGIIATDSTEAANYAISFPSKYFEHIQTNPYKFKAELAEFNHWNAWHYTGVWESKEDAKGGPFASYLFYDGQTDKSYYISTLLHFPQKRKNLYMRQLDVIASSFAIQEK